MTTIPSKQINTAGTMVAYLRTVPPSTPLDIPDLVHENGALRLKKVAKAVQKAAKAVSKRSTKRGADK